MDARLCINLAAEHHEPQRSCSVRASSPTAGQSFPASFLFTPRTSPMRSVQSHQHLFPTDMQADSLKEL
jgi:hypothetical protein